MTKEELKQEAEENSFRYTLDKPWACEVERKQIMTHFEKGYLAGAEPREKRIAELEEAKANLEYLLEGRDNEIDELKKENKVLAQNLEDTEILNNTYEKRFDNLKKENTELQDKLKNLASVAEVRLANWQKYEKENAELKAQLENDRDLPTIAYMQGAEKQKKKDADQLTKAKELLAKWVELYKPKSNTALPTPIQVDTEQFLKEE